MSDFYRTIEHVKKEFPDLRFDIEEEENYVALYFTTKWQRKYVYFCDIHLQDGIHPKVSIGVRVKEQPHNYFWYEPFDPYQAKNLEEEWESCTEVLLEGIELLTHHPTKVVQRKMWLATTYKLFYLKEGEWVYYSGNTGWRNFNHPKIEGRKRVWQ